MANDNREKRHEAWLRLKADPDALERHRTKNREAHRRYAARNLAKLAAYQARYRQTHSERVTAQRGLYRELNYEKVRVWERRAVETKRRRAGELLYSSVKALVPQTLPRHDREDIIGSALLVVLAAKGRKRDLASIVKSAISAHFKMFNRFDTVSLDSPVGDTGLTLMDVLPGEASDQKH